MHSAEQSIVTFGRASYTTATTPRGTLIFLTSRPFGSRWPSIVSPTGSGSAAIARTSGAIPAIRSSVSRSRSSSAAPMSFSSPARMSRSFASMISAVRSSRPVAMASSAASRIAPGVEASVRDASFAAAQISGTVSVRVAMLKEKGTRSGASLEHEVVPVHGFLRRARQQLPHLGGLQPLHLPQLAGRVVDDPLADRPSVAARRRDLHGVSRLKLTEHFPDADRQQAPAPPAQR